MGDALTGILESSTDVRFGPLADISRVVSDVRFSNRPGWVKRVQTIHHSSVDVAHGLALLLGIGTWAFHHGVRERGGTIFTGSCRQLTAGPSGHAISPHP